MGRAQLEIFGLVMIVILVSLGLLFALTVISKKSPREEQKIKENLQAANFLNTAMAVTTDCGERTVRQLLQDCAMAGFEDGRWIGAGMCSDGVNTCEKLSSILDMFLKQTFGKWNANYILFMNNTKSVEQIVLKQGDCSGEREGSTRPEVVRSDFYVTVTLHICS